jgi:hypothetical protein
VDGEAMGYVVLNTENQAIVTSEDSKKWLKKARGMYAEHAEPRKAQS